MTAKTPGADMVPGDMPGQGRHSLHETSASGQGKPPIVEGPGRYVVYETPDGGWVIARATGICDRCTSCGCGEQQETVSLPDFTKGQAHIMQWLMRNGNGGVVAKLREAMGRR